VKNWFTEKFHEEFWDIDQGKVNCLTITSWSLAFFLIALVYYLYFFDPINYAKLISEDQWGEYSTFACFLIGGILLSTLSLKTGDRIRKLVWAIIGIVFLCVAFEEISWGQRIFNFPTPDFFLNQNMQKETTIHNLEFFEYFDLCKIISGLVLIWIGFSLFIHFSAKPSIKDFVIKFGIPYIPFHLIPLFLLVPYFSFVGRSLIQAIEIYEILVGFAVAAWSADLFSRYGLKWPLVGFRWVSLMMTAFVVVGIVSETMAHRYPDLGHLGWRFNYTALQDYARQGKYDQAQKIYEFIYAHPYYSSFYTRIYHGFVLTKMRRQKEAVLVLSEASNDIRKLLEGNVNTSENHRWLGIIFRIRKENEKAEQEFTRAIQMDQTHLDNASNSDLRAHLLWSIGKTLEARGDVDGAIQKVKEGAATKPSIGLDGKLRHWLKIMKRKQESSTEIDTLNFNFMVRLMRFPNEFNEPSTVR